MDITDYGVEDNDSYFVSPCKMCENYIKYIVDKDMRVIKTKIVERKL